MKQGRIALAGAAIVLLSAALVIVVARRGKDETHAAQSAPVLTVALTTPELISLPLRVTASGNIAAWQEASIGAEGDGLRLVEVRVNVGDVVRRGQVIALFNTELVAAELAEAQAAVAQARAQAEEAQANAQRARGLEHSGALSAQQINQYVVAARTAWARLDAVRAAEQKYRLRLAQAQVSAPSDGVISSRTATVGAVVPAGEELFRLIRDGRLEWRAAVAAPDLQKLTPGQRAQITVQGSQPVAGTLRMLAPAVDMQTHSGLAYVDLPRDSALRAGAFARGHFEVGEGRALTLPQSAVLLRDGFSYVMCVAPGSRVFTKKVTLGRRAGDRIEISAGLGAEEAVIASGLSFLSDGDHVRVVGAVQGGAGQQRIATGVPVSDPPQPDVPQQHPPASDAPAPADTAMPKSAP